MDIAAGKAGGTTIVIKSNARTKISVIGTRCWINETKHKKNPIKAKKYQVTRIFRTIPMQKRTPINLKESW